MKKVAILTNGGDAPGLNAVIRSITLACNQNDIEVYGYIEGYKGLLENNYIKLEANTNASGIIHKGGTIIGSSNSTNVFRYKEVDEQGYVTYHDYSDICIKNIEEAGFDCIFTLGGDGTQKSARDFTTKGVKVIGIPKTIDNDVAYTDITFGYNTAVSTATDAIDKLHTTAESHNRVMVLEVMGRYTGWIALESAVAGGADVVLIPEIPFNIEKVCEKIIDRKNDGKEFSIVVVSEGATPIGGDLTVKKIDTNSPDAIKLGGIGDKVASMIEERTGIPSRNTTLGYLQRGGSPTSFDRVLSTKYGTYAVSLALQNIFNVLVVMQGNRLSYVPLEDVVGNNKEIGAISGNTAETNIKRVPLDCELIKTAQLIDISFGV